MSHFCWAWGLDLLGLGPSISLKRLCWLYFTIAQVANTKARTGEREGARVGAALQTGEQLVQQRPLVLQPRSLAPQLSPICAAHNQSDQSAGA